MRFVKLILVFVSIVAVNTAKSECDTYVKCLGSFFGSFFGNLMNFKTDVDVGNVTVPGFDTVNVDSENISHLLSAVSEFVQEELQGDVHFGPQLNIFQNIGNTTAIYVKSITINNNFGAHDRTNKSKSISPKESVNYFSPNANSSDNLNVIKSVPIEYNSTTIKKEYIDNTIEKNEIVDDDPLGIYYDTNEDENCTDYLKIDYLEMYKDTTNEYIEIKPTEQSPSVIKVNDYDKENKNVRPNEIMFGNIKNNASFFIENKCSNSADNVTNATFPWIATIFIKNDTSDLFDYYCDGALLSDTIVVTAARCLEYYGSEVDANNLLVLLGKSSLQSISGAERAVKVKSVTIHENFTKEGPDNDVAILVVEKVTLDKHSIQIACIANETGLESVTTGWAITGELTIIPFDAAHSSNCKLSNGTSFCAAYGNDVTTCPSYGGIYAVKGTNGWYLRGIRSGDPSDRGLCFDRTVHFTDLTYYIEWLNKFISNN